MDADAAREMTDADLHKLADILLARELPDRWIEKIANAFWRRAVTDLRIGVGSFTLTVIWRWLLRWTLIICAFGMAHVLGLFDGSIWSNPSEHR